MKKIATLLLSIWFLLAATSLAHADPITALVTAIASAWGSLGALTQFAIGLALKVGVGLIQKAMAKTPEQKPVGVSGSMDVGGDNAVSFIVGTFATAGQLEYVGTYGKSGKTPNAYLTQVISLGDLPYDEDGFVDLWVAGEKVTVDWEDTAYGDLGAPVTDFRTGDDDNLWIKIHYGDQTVVDPQLMTAHGTEADRPWTNTMIGRGIPYAVVTARYKRDVLTAPPRCTFVMRGIKLYDPRKDSTVGGSGPHRWGTYSTYEWSDNPKVIQYNAMRGIYYNGEWFYGGQGLLNFQFPTSSWFAAMNECDRLITLSGGSTEKNFRAGYEVTGDIQTIDLCKILDKACNGYTAENAGIYKTRCGNFPLSVYFFTDEDLIVSKPQTFNPFPGIEKVFNGVHASYPEPAESWSAKDAPPRYRADLELADDGRRLIANLTYDAVPYKFQVQRLMRAAIETNRRFRSHQGVFTPAGKLLEPLDVITWTSLRNGYINKRFSLGAIDDLNNVNQSAAFSEIDPSDYDWSTDYQLPVSLGPIGKVKPEPRVLTDFEVFPDTVQNAGGIDKRPAILLVWPWDAENVAVRAIGFQVRLTATSEVVFSGRHDQPEQGQVLLAPYSLLPNTAYQVRAKFIGDANIELFDWSAWKAVTTPNILIDAGTDVLDNSVTSQKIADAAVTANKIMDAAITSLKIADLAVSTAKLQVAAVTSAILADSAVIGAKIADAAVTGTKMANATIDATKFASSIEPVTVVNPLPVTRVTASVSYLGVMYRWNGTAYVVAVAAGEITGQIVGTQITNGAITTAKIAANAVTANEILANSITTAKIAVGAVGADQIAANAIIASKILAGAITADKLAIGTSNNLIPNADFAAGTTGYLMAVSGGTWTPLSIRTDTYGISTGSLEVLQNGTQVNDQFADVRVMQADGNTLLFAVQAGKKYEIAFSAFGHRSDYTRMHIEWRNAAGAIISYDWIDIPTHQNFDPVKSLANYVRNSGFATAPVGAVQAGLFFRVRGNTAAYGANSYTWIAQPYFGAAQPNQTEASVWSSGVTTLIADGNIVTGSVNANKLVALSITAAQLSAGAITAGKIAAGAIVAADIAASTITGAKIAANTIGAINIAANAITAKSLVITDFDNLIKNGSFEQGIPHTDTWNFAFPATAGAYLETASGAIAGNTYLVIDRGFPTTGDVMMTTVDSIACKLGDTLSVSLLALGNGYGAGLYVRLVWINSSGASIGETTTIYENGPYPSSWVNIKGKVAVPSGAVRCFMRIYLNGGTAGPRYVILDDIRVSRAYGGELIVDGAITAASLAANSVTAAAIQANSINTAHLTAGAVTAAKMTVTSLDAITATLGAVNISSAIIGSLMVDGQNIVAGAVTAVYTNSLNAATWAGGNRDVTVVVPHGTGSPKVIVMGTGGQSSGGVTGTGNWTLQARTAAGAINLITNSTPNINGYNSGTSVIGIHTPGSGVSSTTYSIRMTGGEVASAAEMTIVVQVLKR